jgi:hypothetical protein
MPETRARLDPAWLADVLAADVVEATVEPLEIAGAVGELARVLLTYEDAGAGGPASVIAKFRGTGETQQAMDAALGIFARERRFYAEVAEQVPVATPRCHFAGDGDELPLLLEDLRGLRMGDQVAGLDRCRRRAPRRRAGDLHATFWERPMPGGALDAVAARPDVRRHAHPAVASGVPALQERYEGRVPERVLAALADAAPNWARCSRAATRARRPSSTTTSASTTSSSERTGRRWSSTGSFLGSAAVRRTSPTCCRGAFSPTC